jgi:hypothetical protein
MRMEGALFFCLVRPSISYMQTTLNFSTEPLKTQQAVHLNEFTLALCSTRLQKYVHCGCLFFSMRFFISRHDMSVI